MIKKILYSLLFTFAIGYGNISAQELYNTTSGEIILGWSNAAYNTPTDGGSLMRNNQAGSVQQNVRFTVWFHLYSNWNYDFNNNIGIFTGIGNRNIGFITEEMSSVPAAGTVSDYYMVQWKRRAYALGIPLGIKVGNFKKGYSFFAAIQYEWLYHYKEKEFLTTGKRKSSDWFSKKVNTFLPSVYAGIMFPKGFSVKYTIALDNFMNKDFVDSDGSTPYRYMDSRIMYVSLYKAVRWQKVTYMKEESENNRIAVL